MCSRALSQKAKLRVLGGALRVNGQKVAFPSGALRVNGQNDASTSDVSGHTGRSCRFCARCPSENQRSVTWLERLEPASEWNPIAEVGRRARLSVRRRASGAPRKSGVGGAEEVRRVQVDSSTTCCFHAAWYAVHVSRVAPSSVSTRARSRSRAAAEMRSAVWWKWSAYSVKPGAPAPMCVHIWPICSESRVAPQLAGRRGSRL